MLLVSSHLAPPFFKEAHRDTGPKYEMRRQAGSLKVVQTSQQTHDFLGVGCVGGHSAGSGSRLLTVNK